MTLARTLWSTAVQTVRLVVALSMFFALAPAPAAAFPGVPDCPANAKTEVGIVPFARHTTTPCDCITFVSCLNLDKKTANVVVQFFNESATPTQNGPDLVEDLEPGEHEQFVTNFQGSLLVAFPATSSAGIASNADLNARVCATTKKVACHAGLSCSCANGVSVSPLTYIVRKQQGD
jgi:hypothetical protein